MAFNFGKLKGRIVEKYDTQAKFASAMKWSERTMSRKINGEVPWNQSDIIKASELLGIANEDIPDYFFVPKVQYN